MGTDAKKLGEIFRIKREENNLTLKEVESSTSIRANYLEAIEEGNIQKFLTTVYMYGFMRQYATFLGLSVEKLSRDFPEVFSLPNEKHEFSYGIGTLERRGSQSGGVKWIPNILWTGGSIAVLLLAWWLAKTLGVLS